LAPISRGEATASSPHREGYLAPERFRRVRLLVVDDDTVFREELSTLLSDWGHQVESVSSAAKALEALAIAEFDVVLSDVRMPRMGGLELLRLVRERWPRIYVVMITGYATVETAVEAMKLGAFDYLRKPFRSEDVQRVIAFIEEQRRFSLGGSPEHDPVRLAERWAKQKREVLLLGAGPKHPVPGITVSEFPLTDSAVGLQELVMRFVESHERPAVVVGGIERLFTVHRAEEVAQLLGDILERVEGKAPVAVGFDPVTLSDQTVLQIRAAISAARVHGTLSALANPLRRHILRRLDEGSTSFTEVMRAAGIDDSPKLSFHLRTLQEDGLITHAGDSYQLSPNGKEAVRVLKEVDQMGSKEEDRILLFPTRSVGEGPAPTSSRGRPRH
jgi:CheY-like chemotaxis protein/DNA-binding HxlR family transcriptional regulator